MATTLRPARLEELSTLSALCLRSKAYWGYDDAFMAACVEELTLTPANLATDQVIVLEDEYGPAGIAQVALDDGLCYLEKLFIDTDRIGQGYGRILFDWAVDAATNTGTREMIVEADPDAAAFYHRMGCIRAGEAKSQSIAGRVLPRFVYPL